MDPYYRGERWWYNPLLPTLQAVVAALSGVDVPVLYARAGSFLNVLAPVAFYLLVHRAAGGFVAAAAVLAYIYVTPRGTQAWHTATYSPWLFAGTFAQPLFYWTLIAIGAMWRGDTMRRRLLVGGGLGLTLLTHTAPALLLGGVLACERCARIVRSTTRVADLRTATAEAAVIVATALAVASPLLLPIVVHYELQIQNWSPMQWSYEILDLHRFGDLAYTHATPATFLAIVGVWRFTVGSAKGVEHRIITYWAVANLLLLLLGYARQLAPGLASVAPPVVPQFHYLAYFRALIAVFAGYGLLAIGEWLHRAMRSVGQRARVPSTSAVAYCLLFVAAVAAMPRLAKRDDFDLPITQALEFGAQDERIAAYRWVKSHVGVDDVVLAPNDLAQSIVGAAGRRVVAVDPNFSNPYVPYAARSAARDEMYRLMRAADRPSFCRLADTYGVSWLVEQARDLPPLEPIEWIRPAFQSPNIVIARIDCGDTADAAK